MKRLEKDPMELMPYLLGVFSAENKTEILKEVMALFDSEKPLSKQLKTLEEVQILLICYGQPLTWLRGGSRLFQIR